MTSRLIKQNIMVDIIESVTNITQCQVNCELNISP